MLLNFRDSELITGMYTASSESDSIWVTLTNKKDDFTVSTLCERCMNNKYVQFFTHAPFTSMTSECKYLDVLT